MMTTLSFITVRVARKWQTAADISAFALVNDHGSLPDIDAGDHIEVRLGEQLVRHYSLTNQPGPAQEYQIGVKREPKSLGGSAKLCEEIKAGDTLTISTPRNNFKLGSTDGRSILIGGGIGITPLLSMARALKRGGARFELHYFCATPAHAAFSEVLEELGDAVQLHYGLDAGTTLTTVADIVAQHEAADRLYVCGPAPMIDGVFTTARRLGWPQDAVRTEYFNADHLQKAEGDRPITVELAQSGKTLIVPVGMPIIQALKDAGLDTDTSCERGVCGTCFTTVLGGKPDHRDAFLTPEERASGECMMICVSRALTDRLKLDL